MFCIDTWPLSTLSYAQEWSRTSSRRRARSCHHIQWLGVRTWHWLVVAPLPFDFQTKISMVKRWYACAMLSAGKSLTSQLHNIVCMDNAESKWSYQPENFKPKLTLQVSYQASWQMCWLSNHSILLMTRQYYRRCLCHRASLPQTLLCLPEMAQPQLNCCTGSLTAKPRATTRPFSFLIDKTRKGGQVPLGQLPASSLYRK